MILDLTPILSLIVHLLPLLLILVRFRQLAEIEVRGPVIPPAPAPSEGAYATQAQRVVSVTVSRDGFVVGGAGEGDPRIPCRGACAAETYDFVALTGVLREAKRLHPEEKRVVIAPASDVPYEVVVGVMDAARSWSEGGVERPLFSDAILASPTDAGASAPAGGSP